MQVGDYNTSDKSFVIFLAQVFESFYFFSINIFKVLIWFDVMLLS